jgi:hypothetical protein
MANMTAMITQSTGADSKFDDLLLNISEYLEFRKIPAHIKLKVTFSLSLLPFYSCLACQLLGFRGLGV